MTTCMRWLSLFTALLTMAMPLAAVGSPAPSTSSSTSACAPQGDSKLKLKAAFEPATAKPGDTVTLKLTATVAEGFHAYGTLEPTNVPVSLDQKKLQLAGLIAKGAAVIPPGDKHVVLGLESYPLPNTFLVTQQLTVPQAAKAGDITVGGELEYQVCDENMCLPPDGARFSAKLTIAPAPQDTGRLQLTASFEPATAKPGDTVTLTLTATVEDGWHAYGTRESTNIPVSFDQKQQQFAGLQPTGAAVIPPGDKHQVFGMDSYPLPSPFRVTQTLKVPSDAKAGDLTVRGALDFQVCDANSCEPPDVAHYTATLKIEAPAPQDTGRLQLTASFEPANAKPGDTVTLTLTATVEDGWHAYGTREPTNIPVSFDQKQQQFAGLQPTGAAVIPPGDKHQVFGMDSYPLPSPFRVTQTLKVPSDAKAGDLTVRGALDFQVCDANSCEPPDVAHYTATLKIEAPAQGREPEPAAPAMLPGIGGDGHLTLSARFEPPTARAGEAVTLVLTAQVEPGWHAYGSKETGNVPISLDTDKLQFAPLQLAGAAEIPPGQPHEGPAGTEYRLPEEFTVKLPMTVPAGTADGEASVRGELGYTVCDENSCEPTSSAPFVAKLVVGKGGAAQADSEPPVPVAPLPVANGHGTRSTGALLQPKYPEIGGEGDLEGSIWSLILLCIGGGLIALVMPCTYPMIPITFSFFTKQADARHGKVLPLALAYGAGIVLIFIVIGVAVGEVIIPFATHWITNLVIGGAFVVFAASLFGFITLQPPGWLTNAAGRAGATGGLAGVFLMGATLVVTSFTCTAPIVGSLLASVATAGRGRVALGMAVFGLTMAAPFMVLAMLPGRVKALPRSGEWMNTLKVSLGFIEVAAAFKFLSNVDVSLGLHWCPREGFLMVWAFVFSLLALFLFGLMRHRGEPVAGTSALRNTFGIASFAFAFYCMFGAMGFQLDQVMTAFEPPYRLRKVEQHEIVVDNQAAAMDLARRQGKYVLINFTGFT